MGVTGPNGQRIYQINKIAANRNSGMAFVTLIKPDNFGMLNVRIPVGNMPSNLREDDFVEYDRAGKRLRRYMGLVDRMPLFPEGM